MKWNKSYLILLILPLCWLAYTGINDHLVREKTNARFAKLSRGVNIFYTVDELNGELINLDNHLNQITIEDVERIKKAGLTHIRFAVSPYPLMHEDRFDAKRWQGKTAQDFLQRIHKMIRLFNDNDIVVVLAVMPKNETFERIYNAPEYENEWVHFFNAWGKEFAIHAPQMLLFETLNEPRFSLFIAHNSSENVEFAEHYPKALLEKANARWVPLEERFVKTIHEQASKHTIIVTADSFSSGFALSLRAPSPYPYVIHAFHYYLPFIFTHQSANWVSDFPVSQIGGLSYPSEVRNCTSVENQSPHEHKARIANYCSTGWNEARHRKELSVVREWSDQHGIPVWLSEFGTYPLKTDNNSVTNYYRDIQKIADEYHFGWCAWEYADWLDRFDRLNLNESARTNNK